MYLTMITKSVLVAGVACVVGVAGAGATERSVNVGQKARAQLHQFDNGQDIAGRPTSFSGKPVTVFCERLRNPDNMSISCRANGASIVVDTVLFSSDARAHSFEHCQGLTSKCSGTVTGVVRYARGVPHIVQAAVDFEQD